MFKISMWSIDLTQDDRIRITKRSKSRIKGVVLSRSKSRKEESSSYSSLNMIGKSSSISESGPFDLITQLAMSPA